MTRLSDSPTPTAFLAKIMTILCSELDLDRAFETIADELAKIVQYDWLSVTVDEAYGISKVAFARGADAWPGLRTCVRH